MRLIALQCLNAQAGVWCRMDNFQPISARSLLWLVVLLSVASLRPTTAVPDYLAPIPAGSATPCQDTAPDCMDVCGCDETGIDFACKLSSPIGEYLRCIICQLSLRSNLA